MSDHRFGPDSELAEAERTSYQRILRAFMEEASRLPPQSQLGALFERLGLNLIRNIPVNKTPEAT